MQVFWFPGIPPQGYSGTQLSLSYDSVIVYRIHSQGGQYHTQKLVPSTKKSYIPMHSYHRYTYVVPKQIYGVSSWRKALRGKSVQKGSFLGNNNEERRETYRRPRRPLDSGGREKSRWSKLTS